VHGGVAAVGGVWETQSTAALRVVSFELAVFSQAPRDGDNGLDSALSTAERRDEGRSFAVGCRASACRCGASPRRLTVAATGKMMREDVKKFDSGCPAPRTVYDAAEISLPRLS